MKQIKKTIIYSDHLCARQRRLAVMKVRLLLLREAEGIALSQEETPRSSLEYPEPYIIRSKIGLSKNINKIMKNDSEESFKSLPNRLTGFQASIRMVQFMLRVK